MLPYTDIIIGFLIPDPNAPLSQLTGDNPDIFGNISALAADIAYLRNPPNPKNVLLSVGGQIAAPGAIGWSAQLYQTWSNQVPLLVQQILMWVDMLGVSGVDIDYEDDFALTTPNTSGYNGVEFLVNLTGTLANNLAGPPGVHAMITHAPPSPFWDTNPVNGNAYNGAYLQVDQMIGYDISWYNTQFYGNGDYDDTIANKVALYQRFVAATGNPQKMLLGILLDPTEQGTSNYANGTADLAAAINQLQADPAIGDAFGGVMAFEYEYDNQNGQAGTGGFWADDIAGAFAKNSAGTLIADSYTALPY